MPKTDWAEVAGLLHEVYRPVALKRMLKKRSMGKQEALAAPYCCSTR
jgi:hypothetical protein